MSEDRERISPDITAAPALASDQAVGAPDASMDWHRPAPAAAAPEVDAAAAGSGDDVAPVAPPAPEADPSTAVPSALSASAPSPSAVAPTPAHGAAPDSSASDAGSASAAPAWSALPAAAAPASQAYPGHRANPAPSSPQPQRSLITVASVALIAGVLGGGIGGQFFRPAGTSTAPGTVLNNAGGDSASRPATSIAGVARRVLPTVVSVDTAGPSGGGNGSGAVIQSTGSTAYVLTNNHVILDVVEGGGRIEVQTQEGERYPAQIVGRDPSYDLAVLRVDHGGLPVISMGDSSKVVVGDGVIAIGSPLGLTGTVTSGIVSALRRPVTTNPSNSSDETSFISAIQTDAAINPGNSGGPLVDAKGRMIGVNSAIATLGQDLTGQSGNIGVGFAIPINQARRVAQQIIRTGASTYPVIGVQLDRTYTGGGARIAIVEPAGPASKSGLRVGDIITRIDGRPMDDSTMVITTIRSYMPGDTISITVRRGSGTASVKVTLGSRPSL